MSGVVLTTLGGYLGAGKTTVLNSLLARAGGRRIAVVVNDFGAIGIDGSLVRSATDDTIELANGCLCCAQTDDLSTVMTGLVARSGSLDAVVVEVSGVGLPDRIASWGRFPGFERGPVVVCADAENVRHRADDRWVGDTVLRQLAAADVVVLTKADLVPAIRLREVEAWLRDTTGGAPIVRSSFGWLDPAVLLELPRAAADRAGVAEDDHDHADHLSWSASGSNVVDRVRLAAFLDALPPEIVRVKGIVRMLDESGRRVIVNRVGKRWSLVDDGPWATGEESRLVVVAVPGAELPGIHDQLRSLVGEHREQEPLLPAP